MLNIPLHYQAVHVQCALSRILHDQVVRYKEYRITKLWDIKNNAWPGCAVSRISLTQDVQYQRYCMTISRISHNQVVQYKKYLITRFYNVQNQKYRMTWLCKIKNNAWPGCTLSRILHDQVVLYNIEDIEYTGWAVQYQGYRMAMLNNITEIA